jgi:predicted RNase H-like HicB family nuclease
MIGSREMRYTIILEPTNEPDKPGWYYAHVPALDLTTHGFGLEGAMEAARDLAAGWVAELRNHGEEVPIEKGAFVSHIEVPNDATHTT